MFPILTELEQPEECCSETGRQRVLDKICGGELLRPLRELLGSLAEIEVQSQAAHKGMIEVMCCES